MRQYNKGAFLAGFKTAVELRGTRPRAKVFRGVRQITIREPYTVEWNNDHSFTISWISSGTGGVVLAPDLFPVTLTATVGAGGNLQWGRCTVEGTMPSIIGTGANRIEFHNSVPNDETITDPSRCLNSVIFGEVFTPAGVEMSVTVEW